MNENLKLIVNEKDEAENVILIDSKDLFKESKLIRILHGNVIYHLKITKGDKLILTK